jgi:hypothetical protein
MRVRFVSVIALAAALCGCGMQLGKYTVSSAGFNLLEPEFGMIAIDRGNRWGASSPDENLLCIVALCPGAKCRPPSDSSSADVMFTSSRRYSWTTESGKLAFSYRWNRSTDAVEIAGSRFSRAAGNVFIARCDGHGAWRVQQLSNINPTVDAHGVLREIQQKLPEDTYIASLSIYL